MDYLEFFGLKEDPFRMTPDSAYFYPSKEHTEILASLQYAIEQKEGFFLATGEPGTGKTTLLKVFINEWKDKAEIALILTPRLNPEEFLMAVLEDLKVQVQERNKNEIIKAFRDFLLGVSEKGKMVIIIVDEAQDLPDETLEELRLLSNLETEKEKLLQIVLIGQPELRDKLASVHMRQLSQRVAIKAILMPLTMPETSDYINYRLIKAGKGIPTFDEKAKRLIYRFSNGIPRLINLLASRSLMAAYIDGSKAIHIRHVRYATSHLSDGAKARPRRLMTMGYGMAAVAVIVAVALGAMGYYYYFYSLQPAKAGVKREVSKEAPKKEDIQKPEVQKPEVQKTEVQENPKVEKEGVKAQEGQKIENARSDVAMGQKKEGPKEIVVVADSANIRPLPSLDTTPVSSVSRGTLLKALGDFKDEKGMYWYKVRLSNNRECWIAGVAVRMAEKNK